MFSFKRNQDDEFEYGMKAMNCPCHCILFKHKTHSYKELPLRYADFGTLHRNELSNTVTSLTRNYAFCQDDAHIFCTPEQIKSEIANALQFLTSIYNKFGFVFSIGLLTKPEQHIGDDDQWAHAEKILEETLTECEFKYNINDKDGAFYGPKIDIKLTDSLNRQHQCATIQLDFQLPSPEHFNLKYIDANNKEQTPIMIHRAIYGSFERFIAILCEHYKGKWPLWLSPFQVKILTINSECSEYATKIKNQLMVNKYHVKIDDSDLTITKKVKIAQKEQYNYILVVGKKEVETNKLSVRHRGGNTSVTMDIDELLSELKHRCDNFY